MVYPKLAAGGRQRLVVLGSEIGGRWNAEALRFVPHLVRLRSHRAPQDLRSAALARLYGDAGIKNHEESSLNQHGIDGRNLCRDGCHFFSPGWSEQPHFWRDGGSSEVPRLGKDACKMILAGTDLASLTVLLSRC